jgi:hypothetical protein
VSPQKPKFDVDAAQRAYDEWGCNCGPSAVAAIMGMSLDEVRPFMGDFERKYYTNPTLMFETLARIGRPWRKVGVAWPEYGLARIQWEGPWTEPGVPVRARYRYTHWVGAGRYNGEIGIFDFNMLSNGSGWSRLHHWDAILVPWLLSECHPRANGKWHITHAIEVQPLSAIAA